MDKEKLLLMAKPILFNTDMVQAILKEENPKTDTRRVVPGKIVLNQQGSHKVCFFPRKIRKDRGREIQSIEYFTLESFAEREAPCHKGDILYVRETFFKFKNNFYYKVDGRHEGLEKLGLKFKWRPSIHMPKEAARIFLKVTDVRVEKLQSMTLDDFLSEGVVLRPEAFNDPENAYQQAMRIFSEIWDSTIKKADRKFYSWEANPWVWVIGFKRMEGYKGK